MENETYIIFVFFFFQIIYTHFFLLKKENNSLLDKLLSYEASKFFQAQRLIYHFASCSQIID